MTLHLILLVPILFACIVPFLYKKFVSSVHTGWFIVPIPLLTFVYLTQYIVDVANGKIITVTMPWIPSLGINHTLYVDGLSLMFGLIITGIGTLVVLYSIYYMSKEREVIHNFYVYLLLFMGAMLGLVFSDHIFVLYVFWELTSVSSFLLIAYWYEREGSRAGAKKSLLITVFGGLALLASLLLLANVTHTYSIREMISQSAMISEHTLFIPIIILLLLGAFTKSAQFPFHIWLPDAMEAPTPVSAYLHSATMVKAGIYLVARFTPLFGGSAAWFWIVATVGLLTLIWGSICAIKQTDLKALLAFSTVSQLGLIMCLLGLGSASLYFGYSDESAFYATAVIAALFHLINHSTFKGCLFMVIGIIDHETGTRDIRKLGGLMTIMPASFTLAVIGSFSMAGLPPFNGFLSKEMFFTGVLHASTLSIFNMESVGLLFPIIAWIASIFTFIYCMIIIFKTFTGPFQKQAFERKIREAPLGMLVAPSILAIFVVLFFFFPNVIAKYVLEPSLRAVVPVVETVQIEISAWHGWSMELFMTIGVVLFGTVLFIYLRKWNWLYELIPTKLTFNYVYERMFEMMEAGSKKITSWYMTGFLRDYVVYILAFFIFTVGCSVFIKGISFDVSGNAPVHLYEGGLIIIAMIAAISIIFATSRMTAIIIVGVLGYIVGMLFVMFKAPDLALTQLVIETVTVALFLLCYYHLPEFRKETGRIRFRSMNALVAIGVGVTVTALAISAQGNKMFASISTFFEGAYELAGSKNIVNAILVDFRGFDTLLEILVLFMSGLGVFMLIRLRLARRDNNNESE